MTETEWWAATGPFEWPHRLFNELFFDGASDRKLRLACVACCRFVEPFAGGAPFPFLLRSIEALADGDEPEDRVKRAVLSIMAWDHERYRSLLDSEGHPTPEEEVEHGARRAILHAGSECRGREWHQAVKKHSYQCFVAEDVLTTAALLGRRDEAELAIIHILHDTFGPLPFRDVPVAAGWRTSDVRALASGIYADRAFDRMPILADALQDAGCSNGDILDHCRGPGPHVRGCWVVDLLLGKE